MQSVRLSSLTPPMDKSCHENLKRHKCRIYATYNKEVSNGRIPEAKNSPTE